MMNKKLILKEEYKDLTISINILGIGMITLDTKNINENKYETYKKLGFNIFDEIEEIQNSNDENTNIELNPLIEEPKSIEQKPKQIKNKTKK